MFAMRSSVAPNACSSPLTAPFISLLAARASPIVCNTAVDQLRLGNGAQFTADSTARRLPHVVAFQQVDIKLRLCTQLLLPRPREQRLNVLWDVRKAPSRVSSCHH